jgi:putative NIF3 family GTP cyclohydrolase 1 type 2
VIGLLILNHLEVRAITAKELVDRIILKVPGAPIPNSVDVFKTGNPNDEITGVAVCMFATMDVLKNAVASKCNFIITHEPIFYNHLDETASFKNDPVVIEKKKYIEDNHLIIWRFHDYWHSVQPDGILVGMAIKLGWKDNAVGKKFDQFQFPETTVKELLDNLKNKFPGNSFQLVGNPNMKFTKLCFSPGASGSAAHIYFLTQEGAEVVVAGESPQWETYEYVRDAVAQGKNKAAIFLGHIPSEDAGMEYCASWLKTFVTETPIVFLECGSSYQVY